MAQPSPLLDPVLVVGGAGALGSHIINLLLNEKHATEVYAFDVTTDAPLRHPNATYIEGSLVSKNELSAVVHKIKPRLTIHTASPANMGHKALKLFDDVNITGTRNVIESLQNLSEPSTRALVYTSSSSVTHDNISDLVNVTEDRPYVLEPEQMEHYTHTKAIAEIMVKDANHKFGLVTAVIRGVMLFGEGDKTLTPQMISNARSGRSRFQIGNGKNSADFTYHGNTAHAHILAGQALLREAAQGLSSIPDDEKVNGEAFVVTNDEPWPFWDMPRAMGAAAGYPTKKEDIWIIPASLYYVMMVVMEWSVWLFSFGRKESQFNRKMVKFLTMERTFDISKAKKRLGYRPRVSMQEGVERSAKWYMEHNVPKSKTE